MTQAKICCLSTGAAMATTRDQDWASASRLCRRRLVGGSRL